MRKTFTSFISFTERSHAYLVSASSDNFNVTVYKKTISNLETVSNSKFIFKDY